MDQAEHRVRVPCPDEAVSKRNRACSSEEVKSVEDLRGGGGVA